MPPKRKKPSRYTEEELNNLSREEMIEDLNDREIAFCEYYIHDYNIKVSAIKAGFAPRSANIQGIKLRNKDEINDYIAWLKLKVYKKANVTALDILNFYAKAAHSDMSDYVTVENGRKLKLKSLEQVDGQLIQEITQNANGVSIKLIPKMEALKRLEAYMDSNPYDWQRKIEERKLEILEERLKLERLKISPEDVEPEDDGFINALHKAAKGIFHDEEGEDEDEE